MLLRIEIVCDHRVRYIQAHISLLPWTYESQKLFDIFLANLFSTKKDLERALFASAI